VVNTGVFLGRSTLDWYLALKVLLGVVSILWTAFKTYYEWKKLYDLNRSKPPAGPEPDTPEPAKKGRKTKENSV